MRLKLAPMHQNQGGVYPSAVPNLILKIFRKLSRLFTYEFKACVSYFEILIDLQTLINFKASTHFENTAIFYTKSFPLLSTVYHFNELSIQQKRGRGIESLRYSDHEFVILKVSRQLYLKIWGLEVSTFGSSFSCRKHPSYRVEAPQWTGSTSVDRKHLSGPEAPLKGWNHPVN